MTDPKQQKLNGQMISLGDDDEESYPDSWYNECLGVLQELNNLDLQTTDEYIPRKKTLKRLFKKLSEEDESEENPKEIVIGTMKYLAKHYPKWTLMKTVKAKIPEYRGWKKKQQNRTTKQNMEEVKQAIKENEDLSKEEVDQKLQDFREGCEDIFD